MGTKRYYSWDRTLAQHGSNLGALAYMVWEYFFSKKIVPH